LYSDLPDELLRFARLCDVTMTHVIIITEKITILRKSWYQRTNARDKFYFSCNYVRIFHWRETMGCF